VETGGKEVKSGTRKGMKLTMVSAMLGLMGAAMVWLAGCQGTNTTTTAKDHNPAAAKDQKIIVYIPCGMREPFDNAIKMFNRNRPGVPVEAFYDNAVVLVTKIIKNGDRPDLMVAPGEVEMNTVCKAGIIDPAKVTNIGTYTLAIIVPKSNPAKVKTLEDLAKPAVRSIAIGEPIENSVGYYAKKSLEYYKLWDKVKGKAISPKHALDVVTFACMKKVDVALAYKTCPLESAPEKADKAAVRVIADIPNESHPPILCKIGVLKESIDTKRAEEFAQYLTSEEVQAVFEKTGLPRLTHLKKAEKPGE
jgi:molybdate transport system substrate-binding protein